MITSDDHPTQSDSQGEPGRIWLDPVDQLAVRALRGEAEAIEQASHHPTLGALSRLAPALALRARSVGIVLSEEPDDPWSLVLRREVVRGLQFDQALRSVAAALDTAAVPWAPIKGLDLRSRVYDLAEERPCFDIDIAVAPSELVRARQALESDGWIGLWTDPRAEAFLAQEGYCWMARSPDGVLLEVHFRLWGMVPEGLLEEMMAQATTESGSESSVGGLRVELPYAFALAACHLFQSAPPRGPIAWWDLERIAARAPTGFVEATVAVARRWDLQLPVALAARYSGSVWQCARATELGERLMLDLRWWERQVAVRALRTGVGRLSLASLVLARLLSGRRSRSGWLGLRRRLWAHPGIVARATPERWPWAARRSFLLFATAVPSRAERLREVLERRFPGSTQ